MAIFEPDRPVTTQTPTVEVENRLEPGTYTFSLTVVDEAANESRPALIRVTIRAA
ncbi:MAG TPA: hypothetical protein VNZ61_14760 [Roseomonas sp.]|nr:hypothetical protein [Roseomonas sp.]